MPSVLKMLAYLSLLVLGGHALALQDCVLTVQEEIAESFYSVALPVFHECLELLNSLHALLAGDSVVGACEYRGRRLNTSRDVFSSSFVEVAFVSELLPKGQYSKIDVIPRRSYLE